MRRFQALSSARTNVFDQNVFSSISWSLATRMYAGTSEMPAILEARNLLSPEITGIDHLRGFLTVMGWIKPWTLMDFAIHQFL